MPSDLIGGRPCRDARLAMRDRRVRRLPVLDATVPRAVRIARCYGMAIPQLVRLDYMPVLAEVAALVINTEGDQQ